VTERYGAVAVVLYKVLVLNLAVAVAKLALGYATGAVSVVSDGLHSLTDSFSNIAALLGVRIARKPPDLDHPYGHRKFETMSAAAIAAFLLVVMIEVGRAAWQRFAHGGGPAVSPASFAVMVATIAVNLIVTVYERRAGERLSSEVLLADATHTRSDVLTSLTVIVALAGSAAGYPLLDPIAAFVVVGFIGYAAMQIVKATSDILGDRVAIPEEEVRSIVMQVPAVLGCHAIRTRGSADFVFLDLHIWMSPETPLDVAHAISHEVKDRLMARFPEIGDAIIHIEPPPRTDADRNRKTENTRTRAGEFEQPRTRA
jgi:cation diffusion facilitator family transporter